MRHVYTPSLFAPPSDLTLADCRVARTRSYTLVSDLIARWHSTLPNAPAVCQVMFVASGPNHTPIAVAMWNHPTATHEDQEHTLELQRQAHGPHAPRNLGTWFLARQRRWIRHNMPHVTRLISYQDADVHRGTLYAADNWTVAGTNDRLTPWTHRPGRSCSAIKNRVKWERVP